MVPPGLNEGILTPIQVKSVAHQQLSDPISGAPDRHPRQVEFSETLCCNFLLWHDQQRSFAVLIKQIGTTSYVGGYF